MTEIDDVTTWLSLARIDATNDSRQHMDCFLRGPSLVFEATNLTCTAILSSKYKVLKYNMAAYACSKVLLKP